MAALAVQDFRLVNPYPASDCHSQILEEEMMRTAKPVGAGVLVAIVLACGPTDPGSGSSLESSGQDLKETGIEEKVIGGGQFVHPDLGTVTFSFSAKRDGDGDVTGRLYQNQHDLGFEYGGVVTCFAVDEVNHRAWIGGVLTSSNDPDPVTEVGDDVWFRVLDLGQGGTEPDRSTFFGFDQGVPPFDTSENYCAAQPWPEDNARTWPVVSGNIKIH
jgi:hypothetical protein